MVKRRLFLKFTFGILLGVMIILLVAFNTLLVWVAIAPRELKQFTPYIEQALSAEDGSYHVKIGDTVLMWDGWKHPIDLRLRKISVLSPEGWVFSTFPEISLGVDIFSLPWGKVLPTRVTINKPIISLLQHEDKSITFGYEKTPETTDAVPRPAVNYMYALDTLLSGKNSRLRKLQYVHVKDASVSIGSRAIGVFFEANKLNLEIVRSDEGVLELKSVADITYGNQQSQAALSAALTKGSPIVTGGFQFRNVMPSVLETLFLTTQHSKPFGMPVSGNLQYRIDIDKKAVDRLMFQLDAAKGTIEHELLEGTLPVTTITLRGEATNDFSKIDVTHFSGDFHGTTLSAQGTVTRGETLAVKADASVQNVQAEQLRLFWPPSLSPVSREWVITNITKGNVPSARAQIDIEPGDLSEPVLPRESINALIALEGGVISYLPEHPPVKDVQAIIHIDGVSLDAEINAAHYMQHTTLSKGSLVIPDLNLDNPRINISFDAKAPASDAVSILKLPRLNHAEHLGLKESAEGSVSAHVELGFDFFAPRDEAGNPGETEVDYKVQVNLSNVSQPGFMRKFDIAGAAGTLNVQNGSLTFQGTGNINGAEVTGADVKYLFTPEEGFDTFIKAKAKAPVSSFKRFGYPDFAFLKGSVGVDADVKLGPEKELSVATLDLLHASVGQNALGWEKPENEPATFKITAEKQGNTLSIPSFELSGKDAELSGALGLSQDLTQIDRVVLHKTKLGNTSLEKLTFERLADGIKLEMSGSSLDLTDYMDTDSDGFSFKNFPAIQFKADVKKVTLSEKAALEDLKGTLNCNSLICPTADITGKTIGKAFHLRIMKNPKGKRQFSLHVENAADFLKAMDIFDGMEGGVLSISGNFDDVKGKTSILKGKLVIIDYVMKDAPILGKILSLASLTGFFETMQGKGISFNKMLVPFTLKEDVITLKDAKTYGPAIGITADGTITMPKAALDINGTVVPSYTLNNVIGKVPLLGDILTGGGEGVFAAKYSVKGTEDNPDVSVNPLSILTPGFLRNMFDATERPKEEAE